MRLDPALESAVIRNTLSCWGSVEDVMTPAMTMVEVLRTFYLRCLFRLDYCD